MSSPKWSGKSKRFNPNRNFVMSDATPTRKFNPKSTFQPSTFTPTANPFATGSADATANGLVTNAVSTPAVTVDPAVGSTDPAFVASVPPVDALEYASLYHPPLHPLQYHTYAPTPFRAHLAPLEPHERRAEDLFMPEDLRKELGDRNEATLQILPASALPEYVHTYHSLVPLDLGKGAKDLQLWGHPSYRYKAVSHTDGRTYCLLRIDGFEMSSENEHALQVINKWKRVHSSGIVGVIEAFTTLAFTEAAATAAATANNNTNAKSPMGSPAIGSPAIGSPAIGTPTTPRTPHHGFSAPSTPLPSGPTNGSSGLFSAGNSSGSSSGSGSSNGGDAQSLVIVYEWYPLSQPLNTLPDPKEPVLWSIAVQLFGSIQAIHRRGLACRGVIDEQFILLQGADRVRLGSLGVQDVLSLELGDVQNEDYKDLGLVLQRLSRPIVASAPFTELLAALAEKNVERASQLLVPHVYKAVDRSLETVDRLEETLSLELANGRLVRLLAKLEFVLNKPEAFNPMNADYPLVLFKQYVFRQRSEQGKPSLNLAHALAALNKLDAGIDEKVMLTSEDMRTRLVVSYKELKHMFSKAFEDARKA